MKKIIITCDRCRKMIEPGGFELSGNGPPEKFDLCTNCRWEFYNIFMFPINTKSKTKSKWEGDMDKDAVKKVLGSEKL